MTLYIAPSLAGLSPPPALEVVDFDAVVAARVADLTGRCIARGIPDAVGVLELESEPLRIGQETDSYFEILLRQRVNEAVRAVLIATSTGNDLNHLALTFYNATRLPVVADSRPYDEAAEDWEDDDTFRDRAVLSMEERSVAGPEGAYVSRALKVPGVLDAACYGEEDGATYADGTPVIAPEVLIVVLARDGDGTPGDALLRAVRDALSAEDVRPIGDRLTIEPATILPYTVEGAIAVPPGTDTEPLLTEARKRVAAYAARRRRIGRLVQRLALGACLRVTDDEDQSLSQPLTDLDPGSKGATFCTRINIEPAVLPETWRE